MPQMIFFGHSFLCAGKIFSPSSVKQYTFASILLTPFLRQLWLIKRRVVKTNTTNSNNNSPIQDYVHPDDQTQPTFEMTPGFKPFTDLKQFLDRRTEIV